MTEAELHWLRHRAEVMESIVEIGCWHGRSTSALLEGCRGTVYAVDHWLGSPDERKSTHKRASLAYDEFMANVGDAPNLKVMQMSSAEAALLIPDVDMVFIDGDHSYEAVLRPKCRRVFSGHDVDMEDVARALEGIPYKRGPGSIWYTEPENNVVAVMTGRIR
jgi:predicted O-methyltransferase YrrM